MSAMGFIEAPSFGITAVLADAVVKSANVRLLGIEITGNENLMIRLAGEVGAMRSGLVVAEKTAEAMGALAVVKCITNPDAGLTGLVHFPNEQNPLYGGSDQFLRDDYPNTKNDIMNAKQEALGIVETQGLTAILEATDAMLKSANVRLIGKEKIGAAYVTVIVGGDVAAVTAAVDAGANAVGQLGKLIAKHVIARPHEDLAALLPK